MKGRGPWAAIVVGLKARGEHGTSEDREGRGLGELEDGVEMLTVKPIGLWCPNIKDR